MNFNSARLTLRARSERDMAVRAFFILGGRCRGNCRGVQFLSPQPVQAVAVRPPSPPTRAARSQASGWGRLILSAARLGNTPIRNGWDSPIGLSRCRSSSRGEEKVPNQHPSRQGIITGREFLAMVASSINVHGVGPRET